LPARKKGQDLEVTFYPDETMENESQPLTEVERLMALEKHPDWEVVVSEELVEPHKQVSRTLRSLKGAKPGVRLLVKPRPRGCLDVEVSRSSIDRAMRIMDALVKALESRGVGLVESSEKGEVVQFFFMDETLGIRLEEKVDRREHVLSAQEEKRISRDQWYRYKLPKYDYLPTGYLTLAIKGHWLYGLRVSWSDGKVQRIENRLNAFIAGFIQAAGRVHAERLKREQEEREREERRRRNEEIRKLQEIEQARLDKLLQQAQDWNKAQQIRAFVNEVVSRESLNADDKECAIGSNEWIEWALAQADRLDPLSDSPVSILDEKVEVYRYW
jgi:hypothetical protein